MSGFNERLARLQEDIRCAAERVGRAPDAVRLVGVSKAHPVERLQEAYASGLRTFGESYAQEFVRKVGEMPSDVEWHFIGQLQTNKVRDVVRHAQWVHAVDRVRLLDELDKRATAPLQVLLQVSVAREPSKGGVDPDDLEALVQHAATLPNVQLRGLMAVPPLVDDPEDARKWFRELAQALPQVQRVWTEAGGANPDLVNELSMGMSDDMAVAIEEGATLVRVGSRLFGERGAP